MVKKLVSVLISRIGQTLAFLTIALGPADKVDSQIA